MEKMKKELNDHTKEEPKPETDKTQENEKEKEKPKQTPQSNQTDLPDSLKFAEFKTGAEIKNEVITKFFAIKYPHYFYSYILLTFASSFVNFVKVEVFWVLLCISVNSTHINELLTSVDRIQDGPHQTFPARHYQIIW